VSVPANDSETISVESSGVTAIPLGNASPSATRRTRPSGVTRATNLGRLALAGMEVGAAVDVDPAVAVDHDLVEVRAEHAQIGVVDQRAVGLLAQQPALGPGDHQQPPVRQPVDRERDGGRRRGHHLGVAVEVDGQDLLGPPVGQPQPAVVPARRLADL
jgi:hypothetical protein